MKKKLSHENSEVTENETIESADSDSVNFDIAAGKHVELHGSSVLHNNCVTNSGQLRNSGEAEISGLELHDSSDFTNAGNVTDHDGVKLGVHPTDAVKVRNLAGASWTLGPNAVIGATSGSRFANLGMLRNDAGSDDTNNATLLHHGTLHIDGKLHQNGLARVFGDIEGEGEIDFKRVILNGCDVSEHAWTADAAVIAGHVTSDSQSVTAHRFILTAGAELDFTANGLVLGAATVFAGDGVVDFTGAAAISDIRLLAGVDLANSGEITTAGAQADQRVSIRAVPSRVGQIEISNLAGATWTDAAAAGTRFSASDGGAEFANSGLFVDASAGGTTFDIAVVNDGVMREAAYGASDGFGHIVFRRGLTGAGTVEVGPGSVEVDAAAGAGQTFAFQATAAGALTLTDVQQFNAAISGFGQIAQDLLVVDTSDFAFESFVADAGGSGGSLMFSDGATETAVHLTGVYDAALFHAAVSGHTTSITYG